MVETVTPEYFPGVFAIQTREKCSCDHHKCGQSGRNKVYQIIQFCRCKSKIVIFLIFIAHHGIHGIDRFIQKCQRRTADSHEKQWGDHPIGSIFRHGFYGCFHNALRRKGLGISSHDHGHRIAGTLCILLFKSMIHLHTFRF